MEQANMILEKARLSHDSVNSIMASVRRLSSINCALLIAMIDTTVLGVLVRFAFLGLFIFTMHTYFATS